MGAQGNIGKSGPIGKKGKLVMSFSSSNKMKETHSEHIISWKLWLFFLLNGVFSVSLTWVLHKEALISQNQKDMEHKVLEGSILNSVPGSIDSY